MIRMIRLYSLFQFFTSLFIWLPIFYDFQRKIGLSESEIFGIQSIYFMVFCVLEVPTGLLADQFGRLNCLRLGAICHLIAQVLVISMPNYAGFVTHFIFMAISRSLISGAASAYVYDSLSEAGKVSDYKKVEGRAHAFSLLGRIIFWPAAGYFMQLHLNLPYWLTGVSAVVGIIMVFALPKEPFRKRGSVLTTLKPAIALLAGSPKVCSIILQGTTIFILARLCQVCLFQPILIEKSFSATTFGFIMAFMSVCEAIGASNSGFLKKWLNEVNSIFLLTVSCALMFFVLAFSNQYLTIAALGVFSLSMGNCFPIHRQLLNDSVVNSSYRATLLSIESMFNRAICSGIIWGLRVYIKDGEISDFLVRSSVVSLIGVFVLMLAMRAIASSAKLKVEILGKPKWVE
jgi:MFS family permease